MTKVDLFESHEALGKMSLLIKLRLYRPLMRLAHRFNWHYAPPIYPEGDTHLWCKWCGFRQTVRKANYKPAIYTSEQAKSMIGSVK